LAYFGGMVGNLGMALVWTTMLLDWLVRGAILSRRFRRLRLKEVRL
jgi:Na+-driven multidrug efflux pump